MSRIRSYLGFIACWLVCGGGHPKCMAQDSSPAASRPTPRDLVVLKGVDAVRNRFNADKAKLRVVALVSPT